MNERLEFLKQYYENQKQILDLIVKNDNLVTKYVKTTGELVLSTDEYGNEYFVGANVWKVYTIRGELYKYGKKCYKYIQQQHRTSKRPHIVSDMGYSACSSVAFPSYEAAQSFLNKFLNSKARGNYDPRTEWKIVEYRTNEGSVNSSMKFYKREDKEYGEYFLPYRKKFQ